MHIVFETPRLYLRRFTNDDGNIIMDLNGDPDVLKYIHEPPINTKERASEILLTIILPQYENNLGRWAIHLKATHEFIGWCGLKYLAESGEIDLGYRLKKSAWGNGFATEAAQASLEYGLLKLKLPLIVGRAHVHNHASIKVLEKIGMKFWKEDIVDDCLVRIYQSFAPMGLLKSRN